jgi:hypothetical protein
MRNDVHFAALRAAAKVAFSVASVALVNGCASDAADDTRGDDTASNEAALASKGETKAPCPDAKPSKPSCEAVLASTFPVPGDYQWEPVRQSAEVVACCDKELTTHGAQSNYRWDCCVAYDPNTVPAGEVPPSSSSGDHALACTPWGPPVPPSMNRNRGHRRTRFTRQVSGLNILRAVA